MDRCKLPQELIDAIIDNIDDDESYPCRWTLQRCSLVCRSWLPRCQRRIFRRIVLLPPHRRYRPHPESNSQRLRLILLKYPHISRYILELKVYEGQVEKDRDWIGTDKTLPLVLSSLKNLTRIEFRRLEWSELPPNLRRSICSVLELPSLVSLDMELCVFASMDNFASLLSHAQGLTGLSLSYISTSRFMEPLRGEDTSQVIGAEEQGEYSRRRTRRHLLDLHLGSYCFVEWLLGAQASSDVSHIRTLHIPKIWSRSDTDKVNRLLCAIGRSLRQLKLDMSLNLFDELDIDINFEHNSDLKSLHITHIPVEQDAVPHMNPSQMLMSLLSRIGEACRLDEIKLEVDIPGYHHGPTNWSAWGGVDLILAGSHFKFLRKVDIELWPRGSQEPVWFKESCRNLTCRLPLLGARGILGEVK